MSQVKYIIIDNKKVKVTLDEEEEFNKIVKVYTTSSNNGENYFKGLFEVNEDGIITMIRTEGRETSFEILFFLLNIMTNQWLREFGKSIHQANKLVANKINAAVNTLNSLQTRVEALEQKLKDK